MKRLAWSLGEPLILGEMSFVDPSTLARTTLATPSLRPAVVAAHASGDLLAWLESLSPALRDELQVSRRFRRKDSAPREVVSTLVRIVEKAPAKALEKAEKAPKGDKGSKPAKASKPQKAAPKKADKPKAKPAPAKADKGAKKPSKKK